MPPHRPAPAPPRRAGPFRKNPCPVLLALLALLPLAASAQTVDTRVGYNSLDLCITTSQVAGEFFVTSVPGQADVVVDGAKVGTTSSTVPGSLRVSLSAGEHTIVISKMDYRPYTIRVCLQNGKTTYTEVRLDFQPGATSAPSPGTSPGGGSALCTFRADPSVSLTSTRTTATVDQDVILPLSIINPSANDCDMMADLVIGIPSGVSVEGTSSVAGGSNQFLNTYTVKPGEHRNIGLRVKGNEPGEKLIAGTVQYYPKGNKDALQIFGLSASVQFTAPVPSSVARQINNTDPRPSPGMEFPLALAALVALALFYSGRKSGR